MFSEIEVVLEIIKNTLEIIALFVGGYLVVFVYFQLSPALILRIIPRWIDKQSLVIRLEIENISRVCLKKEYIILQILEYSSKKSSELSEWIPFSESEIINKERPFKWNLPVDIFETTEYVYPHEVLTIERFYKVQNNNSLLHIGLQCKSKAILPHLKLRLFGHRERWTTTSFTFFKDVS